MNKMIRTIALLLPLLLMLTGCDFLRKLAGRPTSEDIAVMAECIRQKEAAALKAREDSIAAAEALRRHLADSVAAVEALKGEKVLGPARFGGIRTTEPLPRYIIILGAFSSQANAERYAAQLQEKGYPSRMLPFGNSFTGVGICATDDVISIAASIKDVKGQDFCPEGVWILENRQP